VHEQFAVPVDGEVIDATNSPAKTTRSPNSKPQCANATPSSQPSAADSINATHRWLIYYAAGLSQLVLDLLLQEKILHTGHRIQLAAPDHLRIVTLPWSPDLANAIERLSNFLAGYRQ
jgi:hypothetical protein